MNRKFEKALPPILIVLIPLLLYWRLVFAGEVLYWGVPLFQFYPWRSLVTEALRAGHLPLWTDLLGNGAPLLANHQSAIFYPFNLIYLVMPVEHAMGYSVVLHVILAGLFAYAWGRTIRLSRFGAMVIGLTFMLSAFFVSRTQFITIINGAAWLPLLFLLAERMVYRRTLLDAVWLGLAMALQFLAGHAQLWFYTLWIVAAYVLARAYSMRREQRCDSAADIAQGPRYGRILVLLFGAFILSLGLSAVQLLPTAELALHSQRADGLDLEEAMTYSFWPWRLLTLAIPNLFGSPATGDYWGYATYWEDAGYIGLLPLLLALIAVWGWGRRWLPSIRRTRSIEIRRDEAQNAGKGSDGFFILFFLVLGLFSLVMAMGKNTPVYSFIFGHVPGFGAFRAPARFILFFTFGASTLAGFGAERFRLTYHTQYVARLTVAGAAAMLVVSLFAEQIGLTIEPTFAPAFAQFAALLGLSAVLLMLFPLHASEEAADPRLARSPLPKSVWRGLVIGFVTIDLALFAAPLTPTIDSALYTTTTDADRFFMTRADEDRLFVTHEYDHNTKFGLYFDFADWGPSDLGHWLSFRETLVPNLNVLSRGLGVNNDDPLVVGRWRDLMDALRNSDWPARVRLLRLMNVGYVLAEGSPAGLARVDGIRHLYRLPESLPRIWFVARARIIPDPDDLLSELMAASFDPTTEVLLESTSRSSGPSVGKDLADVPPSLEPSRSTPALNSDSSIAIISLRDDGNSRTIDLVVSQPGYLVLVDTYYPGWRATVEGRPVEILRANYAFMALPVEPGEHRVALRYEPASFRLGLIISGLTLVVIALVGLRAISKSQLLSQHR
jgi:hypothetical protein